jgi:hypothetical protein
MSGVLDFTLMDMTDFPLGRLVMGALRVLFRAFRAASNDLARTDSSGLR